MIPKKIHMIWLGSSLPEKFNKLIDSVKTVNYDYEFILWSDDNIDFRLENKELFDNTNNLGSKSDILRMEILNIYGGIYMDCDFYQCKKFDDLLNYDFVIGSGLKNELWNGLMMAKPNSEIVRAYLKSIETNIPNTEDIMKATGPYRMKKVFDQNTFTENFKILIGDYFYPFDANQRFRIRNITEEDIDFFSTYKTDNTYCIHLHTCSWQ
jgi:mannosyltransferase OCH1-like enzyme